MGPVVAQIHRKCGNSGKKVGSTDQVLGDIVIVFDQRDRQMLFRDDLFHLCQEISADLRIEQGLRRDLPQGNSVALCKIAVLRDRKIDPVPKKGDALDMSILFLYGVTTKS